MVIPRACYDTRARNKYAGAETFFREICGTFICCLSAGIFARILSFIFSKNSKIKFNPKSWYTKESLETLSAAWDGSTESYVKNVFENLSGRDGKKINRFKDIDWQNIEWADEKVFECAEKLKFFPHIPGNGFKQGHELSRSCPCLKHTVGQMGKISKNCHFLDFSASSFEKIKFENGAYTDIWKTLISKEGFINTFTAAIKDEKLCEKDKKNLFLIFDNRLVNALGAERDTEICIKDHRFSARLGNILRDTYDMGKDILNKNNSAEIIKTISKVNKMKGIGAIAASCVLGVTNQYINRKITEKRTGKKGFVGDIDFVSTFKAAEKKDNLLLLKKIAASAVMAGMVFSVSGAKNLKHFFKKLEFSGPVTSGNAIKAVYASTIIGRFLAADNGTELRESMTRDYLDFLNWLVLGGFAAKGAANLMDKKGENLFNYTKSGSGLKHWLRDISLKTHNEIASKGKNFAEKNMYKLNIAQTAGILYSAITLGILLPMLNTKITERRAKTTRESSD